MFKETKGRSIRKAISWRIIAFLNSWVVLSLINIDSDALNAFIMNITGFVLFYFFERIWDKIKYGKKIEK